MNKDKIRKIISEILQEQDLLNEIDYAPSEPKYFEFFNVNDKEKQYIFTTDNDFNYVLSIMKTCLNLKNKNAIDLCVDNKIESEHSQCYKFLAVNFFVYEDNPNSKESFIKKTSNQEPIQIMKNISWLLNDFMEKNKDENYFMFSTEPKRMNMYKVVIDKNFSNNFTIFPPDIYDKAYPDKIMLLIKK